ncbi:hypothetical protein ACQKWADRAFT_136669 [Trichoderma austrokoningii]
MSVNILVLDKSRTTITYHLRALRAMTYLTTFGQLQLHASLSELMLYPNGEVLTWRRATERIMQWSRDAQNLSSMKDLTRTMSISCRSFEPLSEHIKEEERDFQPWSSNFRRYKEIGVDGQESWSHQAFVLSSVTVLGSIRHSNTVGMLAAPIDHLADLFRKFPYQRYPLIL